MYKIHEQDKMAVLKHVLCSLMNMLDFFHMEVFNIGVTNCTNEVSFTPGCSFCRRWKNTFLFRVSSRF